MMRLFRLSDNLLLVASDLETAKKACLEIGFENVALIEDQTGLKDDPDHPRRKEALEIILDGDSTTVVYLFDSSIVCHPLTQTQQAATF